MNEYFDFVLVKHEDSSRPFLFYAPAFSRLERGDVVTVDTKKGVQTATVLASITLRVDDQKKIDFIMKATGASSDVKRVLSKVSFNIFEYEEDDHE